MAWLEERHRPMRRFLLRYELRDGRVEWEWDRDKWRASVARDGAYLLRAHWPGQNDPAALWAAYIQLTEAEAAFRTLKSEIKVRPIWHWKEERVEAHILVALLHAAHIAPLRRSPLRFASGQPSAGCLATLGSSATRCGCA